MQNKTIKVRNYKDLVAIVLLETRLGVAIKYNIYL